ncbi:helix-turn-helix domain-containing protein [Ditylenchus destructor]|uniref:Helix-turn-helix domain-containing protein n=1 Tax=Ditylenchus destructor TaxID=166010 RepID=A0AAD4QWV6_9BILA|nr:helix-turn-helix domain-containing protein [Ditylenchus destructor]
MGRGTQLTDLEKGAIQAFKSQGLSNRSIASQIGRSANVIDNYVKDSDAYGLKKSSGRPQKLTPRIKRRLEFAASNSQIGSRPLRTALAPHCSHVTVWKALKSSPRLQRQLMKKKPRLTGQHVPTRYRWARDHVHWRQEWRQAARLLAAPPGFRIFVYLMRPIGRGVGRGGFTSDLKCSTVNSK